jgi:adenylate cyclase
VSEAIDFAAEGLLDGLSGRERKAREELLEHLAADGISLDELKAAVAEDRLVLLPLERALGGKYTAQEVADRAGLPLEELARIRRASGLPEPGGEERVYGDLDVAAAESIKEFFDAGLPPESVLDISRVLGEGMSRLAATVTGAFARAFLKPGDTERDVAVRFDALTDQLLPRLYPTLAGTATAHLRESIRRGMVGRAEREAGRVAEEQMMFVGFADLVGFTALGAEVGVEELGGVAGRLGALAADVAQSPVRLIKTIGDAAMFVCPEAPPMVEAALSLVEAVEAADLPVLRAGIAYGPTLIRAGDFYGNSVNLASRVTGIARPGSVLCTEEVRNAAADQFAWSNAGRHRLKGIDDPVPLFRGRRPDSEEAAAVVERKTRERRASASRSKADRRRRRASS